jgi:hypothetical protein
MTQRLTLSHIDLSQHYIPGKLSRIGYSEVSIFSLNVYGNRPPDFVPPSLVPNQTLV